MIGPKTSAVLPSFDAATNSQSAKVATPKLPDGPCLAHGYRSFSPPVLTATTVTKQNPLVISEKAKTELSAKLAPAEYEEECSITLITFKELAEHDDLALTKCGHKFSQTELKKWLGSHSTCPNPYCSKNIKENELISISLKTETAAKDALASSSENTSEEVAITPLVAPPPVVIKPQFIPIINGVPSPDITVKEALAKKAPGESIEVLNTATNSIARMMPMPERLRWKGPGRVNRRLPLPTENKA
jgi:hypothetical protein